MSRTDATHFLNSCAGCVTRPLGDRAELQTFGFHLINLPVGPVALEFHLHIFAKKNVYSHEVTGVAWIGPKMFQVEAEDFLTIRLVARRMICVTLTHHTWFALLWTMTGF